MNKRKLNVASLMINLTVFILVAYSVAHGFRTDIIRETEIINGFFITDFTGFQSFRYFTTLSNAFAAIASAILLVFNVKNVINDGYFFPKWAMTLKYAATSAVALTFLTVALFLSPLIAINGGRWFMLFEGNGFFLHFLIPALAVCGFIVFEKTPYPDFKRTLLAALPTAVYAAVYAVMVISVKAWPDFYGFTFNGTYWKTALTVFMICAASYGLSVLLYALRRKKTKFYRRRLLPATAKIQSDL